MQKKGRIRFETVISAKKKSLHRAKIYKELLKISIYKEQHVQREWQTQEEQMLPQMQSWFEMKLTQKLMQLSLLLNQQVPQCSLSFELLLILQPQLL